MRMSKNLIIGFGLVSPALALACLLSTGCKTTSTSADKGGAQLWAENCQRCHNFRSPASLSDAHWEVAMHRMRVRANLTAEEHEEIVNFLKSAN